MAWWLFQNVVMTAGLALAVAIVCRTTRIGPVARHALWVIVLVKFVTPPLVVWPWAAPDPLRVAAVDLETGRDPIDGGPVAGVALEVPGPEGIAEPSPAHVPPAFAVDRAGAELAGVWPWAVAAWIFGSLSLLVIEVARLARLVRRARGGRSADRELGRRVDAMAARLGVRPVDVRVVPGDTPPAVWCLGRPQLLWPAALAASASDVCVDGLIAHELAHVKRRDHLVSWLELAAGIVWWWNPLFWYVRASLREQAELSCDAWVTSVLPDGRRAYAESLLTLSGAAAPGPMSMAVVGVRAGSRRVLERRLAMIMKGRTPLRLTTASLLGLGLVAMATLPGWAAAEQNPPPPPPPPVPVVQPTPAPPPPPPAAVVAVPSKPRPVPAMAAPAAPPAPRPVQTPAVPKTVTPVPSPKLIAWYQRVALPDEGQKLVEGFEADREAIEREIEQKVAARREVLVRALEALQDQYARAGKLDEALDIREFLRAGMPGLDARHDWIRQLLPGGRE